jgi:small nuclear ribonucleoprotein (snRNP)-like protein
MKNTKVTVTVTYEMEYDGEVTEADIELNDIIEDADAITDIKVNTKSVKS